MLRWEKNIWFTIEYHTNIRILIKGFVDILKATTCMKSQIYILFYMCHVVRKPAFCICKTKDADQLRGNREADQRLCFHYIDSTIPLLPIYEISSLKPSCVVVQPGLCGAWSETPKTGFLTTRLIWWLNTGLTVQLLVQPYLRHPSVILCTCCASVKNGKSTFEINSKIVHHKTGCSYPWSSLNMNNQFSHHIFQSVKKFR